MQGLVAEAGRPTPEQIAELDELRAGQRARAREHASQLRAAGSGRSTSSARRSRQRAHGAQPSTSTARASSTPAVAAGVEPSAWGALADTVTICFSKGLGCPVRRHPRRPGGDDRAGVGGEVPLRRRAPPVGDRRGSDALRARPQRRAARRRPRARAAARGGDRHRSRDRRDELRPDPRRARLARAAARAGRRRRWSPARLAARRHAPRRRGRRRSSRRSSECRRCSVHA